MFTKKIWIGFIILIIVYALALQEGEGLNYMYKASRQYKHLIHLFFFIFFFTVGYWSWNNYKEKWIVKIWIIFYSLIFIVFSSIALVDLFHKIESINIRQIFGNVRLFCTSPLPFGICMLLVKLKNNSQKKIK